MPLLRATFLPFLLGLLLAAAAAAAESVSAAYPAAPWLCAAPPPPYLPLLPSPIGSGGMSAGCAGAS